MKIKALDRIKDAVFQNKKATNDDYYSLIIRIYTATFRKDVPLTPIIARPFIFISKYDLQGKLTW